MKRATPRSRTPAAARRSSTHGHAAAKGFRYREQYGVIVLREREADQRRAPARPGAHTARNKRPSIRK